MAEQKMKEITRVRGYGVVWDKGKKAPLCKFEKGGYLEDPPKPVLDALTKMTGADGKPLYPVEKIQVAVEIDKPEE